jgi:hypothetical protein
MPTALFKKSGMALYRAVVKSNTDTTRNVKKGAGFKGWSQEVSFVAFR